MNGEAPIGRCWFCAEDDLVLTDEHVLAESHFGARLVAAKRVCAACNSEAGAIERLITEHPFLGEAIGTLRAEAARGSHAYPKSHGRLADGSEVQVERREDGNHVIALTPRYVETDPDGTEVWAVEAGTERKIEERRRKRGETIRAVGRPLGELRVTEVHYGIGLESAIAWGRFVAKVVLGVASLSLPIDWLDSTDAQRLRCCFKDRPLPDGERLPMPLDALEQDRGAPPWSLLLPDHLLQLRPNETGGTRFLLALFGYLGAEVDLPETLCPEGGCAWVVPSDHGPPAKYSLPALDAELKDRSFGTAEEFESRVSVDDLL